MKKNENAINSCYYGEMPNVTKKILSLSNLSFLKSETILSRQMISERKK